MAEIKTAPAATSFDCFTAGWNSGDTTSARNSNAVLRASAVQTAMTANVSQHHSAGDTSRSSPARTAAIVAHACTQAFCCDFSIVQMPTNACRKLRIRPVNSNGRVVISFPCEWRRPGVLSNVARACWFYDARCSPFQALCRLMTYDPQAQYAAEYRVFRPLGIPPPTGVRFKVENAGIPADVISPSRIDQTCHAA